MPELPDVEVFRRYFEQTSLKQEISRVDVLDERILKDTTPRKLANALKGGRFRSTTRRGKYMFAATDGDTWLVLHFGMTGYLSYLRDGDDPPRHTRVLFSFTNGCQLAFVDMRILGLASVTPEPEKFVEDRKLGPDALALGFDEFEQILTRRRGAVKSVITNQAILAGIGNIYADEILFQSRIHPKSKPGSLDREQLQTLHQQLHEVSEAAVEAGVEVERMPEHFLLQHRKTDESCPRCGSEIETLKISNRTSYYCPNCQPESWDKQGSYRRVERSCSTVFR